MVKGDHTPLESLYTVLAAKSLGTDITHYYAFPPHGYPTQPPRHGSQQQQFQATT